MNLDENTTNVIVLESPKNYREAIQSVNRAISQDSGEWIFSENDKIIKKNSCIEIIYSLFDLDFQSRKIQKAIIDDLYGVAVDEEHYEKTQKLLNELEAYFYELEWHVGYNINVDLDSFQNLLKAGVSGVITSDDLVEQLNEYIKISARMLKTKLIVLVDMLENFSFEEWDMIEKTAKYEGIVLLCMERKVINKNTNMIIIDSDNCRVV